MNDLGKNAIGIIQDNNKDKDEHLTVFKGVETIELPKNDTSGKSLEEDEIFFVNSTILDEFYNTLNLISLKIDSGVLKDVKKAHISKLCYLSFFISNSVLPQSYKDKMCSIINEIFVKC